MARTNTEQVERKCIVCSDNATHGPRCHAHHKAWKSAAARRRRDKVKIKETRDWAKLRRAGWQRCRQCGRKKRLSEFSTTLDKRRGRPNKICDACLTRIYNNPARLAADTSLSPEFWRKRAYTANSVGRQRLARERAVPVAQVQLSDLLHIVKPQDLAKLYAEQSGRCYYCRCELAPSNITVDHALSLSEGGEHALHNLRICCIDCNHLKHTRSAPEFMRFVREYIKRFNVLEVPDKEPGQ